MKHSKIKQHENTGKELIPPFLKGELGSTIHLHSWSRERVPEYIWLGLLRDSCVTKKEYFDKFYNLKEYVLNRFEEPLDKFSNILKMDESSKKEFFEIIVDIFGPHVLDPLIVVSYFDDDIREIFYNKDNNNDKRILKLQEIVTKMYERYDEFAMDVRYSVIILKLNRVRFLSNLKNSIMIEALTKYPYMDYNSPEMKLYSTSLSSFEGLDFSFNNNYEYSKYFYEEMYLMTDCNPMILSYEENVDYEKIKEKMLELRKLLIKSNEITYDDKRDVIIGNITYVYKMINEIISNNLGDSIV